MMDRMTVLPLLVGHKCQNPRNGAKDIIGPAALEERLMTAVMENNKRTDNKSRSNYDKEA